MAKKKRKPKGKKVGAVSGAKASSVKDDAARTEAEASDDEDAPEEEAPEEAAAEAEQSSAEEKPAKSPKIRGRAARTGAPDVDPNLPRPEGGQVSNKGGLVFVAIVLGLIGLAIAAQFTMGQ